MTKKVYSHDDGVRMARYRDEFEHASVFGKWLGCYRIRGFDETFDQMTQPPENRVFVIYSYGEHFPMYVWDEGTHQWLGNKDKYSRTTSTHQSKYRPSEVANWFDTATLKKILRYGYIGHITNRMESRL